MWRRGGAVPWVLTRRRQQRKHHPDASLKNPENLREYLHTNGSVGDWFGLGWAVLAVLGWADLGVARSIALKDYLCL